MDLPEVSDIAARCQGASDREAFVLLKDWGEGVIHAGNQSAGQDWVARLEAALEQVQLPTSDVHQLVYNLSWEARDHGHPDPLAGVAIDQSSVTRIHAAAFMRRFEFKFESLLSLYRTARLNYPHDSLLRCFYAFAAAGLNLEFAGELIDELLADATLDLPSRYLLLQALWLGISAGGTAQRTLDLADELIRHGDDTANLYFWRSAALRKLHRYDEALASIDEAIGRHQMGMNAVHQDYMRERELVLAVRDLSAALESLREETRAEFDAHLRAALEEATQSLHRRTEEAERMVRGSLGSVIEILGLFLTLVGFLVATGVLAFGAGTFWHRFASVAILLVGSCAFFGLLRLVAGGRGRAPG